MVENENHSETPTDITDIDSEAVEAVEPSPAASPEAEPAPTDMPDMDETPQPALPEPAAPDQKSSTPWLLLVIALLVGGLGGFSLRPLIFPEQQPVVAPLADVEDSGQMNELDPYQSVMLAVESGARHYQGSPDAPITIIEFADFNCGYCGRWAAETLPKIDEKYIQSGQVKMAYVHFPILGADSMTAAQAAECAAKQDKFWELHNQLYANQGIGFTPANLKTLAGEMGLDTGAFEQCLADFPDSDQQRIDSDIRLSQVMGVRGTPAFLVNGIPLAGAYPYEDFERIIDQLLEQNTSG